VARRFGVISGPNAMATLAKNSIFTQRCPGNDERRANGRHLVGGHYSGAGQALDWQSRPWTSINEPGSAS
jgi:hypothetical protein